MQVKYDASTGLIPAIIQDSQTRNVLMLGYMNAEALQQTIDSGKVTFYSRSKQRLWTKGEESGNFLHVVDIKNDCDNDTLLIQAKPAGPVCHNGTGTCWGTDNPAQPLQFIQHLEQVIESRKNSSNKDSYTASLFSKGINKIAQKVGEEATELVIEAKDDNRDLFLNEAADLLFHYLILLQAKNATLADVVEVLKSREK